MAQVAGNGGMGGAGSGNYQYILAAMSRERRRRRVEKMRGAPPTAPVDPLPPGYGGGGGLFPQNGGHEVNVENTRKEIPELLDLFPTSPVVESENAVPAVGKVETAGRLRYMEDVVVIKTNLCSPALNRGLPVHFFAVYDGHGGSHVACACKEKLHAILEEELMCMGYPLGLSLGGGYSGSVAPPPPPGLVADESLLQESWRRVFCRCFSRTEMAVTTVCTCGKEGAKCKCGSSTALAFTGTTAVVVVLTQEHIIVANCGDSRAILCRGHGTIPLSFDQKPTRPDEMSRIQACGGKIMYMGDIARIEGILSLSRAIGDTHLKPFVISEPEVTFTKRDPKDECIILGSDGLWDVVPNNMAYKVARQCLKEDMLSMALTGAAPVEPGGSGAALPTRGASAAAALLAHIAMARGSCDNISVVVIDLKRSNPMFT